MKKTMLLTALFAGMLFFGSCKKCKTCQCWKNGQETEMQNCSYGFPPSTSALDAFDDYLVEIQGYDSVKCVTE